MTWSNKVLSNWTWYGPGFKSVKLSKSVNADRVTLVRTSAICSSPAIRRRCSAARAPPALPYETTPIALLFHSAYRKSMAFLSTPDVEWLYSGVTNTNPSNRAMVAAQSWVWGFWYWPAIGGSGSSRGGGGWGRGGGGVDSGGSP